MTLELRCADLGLACRTTVTADDEATLIAEVGEHARDAHAVELTQTLVDYARDRARQV